MSDEFYWKYLDQQVFHVTSVKGYKGILKQRALIPNSGERDFTFSQSEMSYAKKNSYISLFDFYTAPAKKVEVTKHLWIGIVAKHNPTIAILLDIEDINKEIIPNSVLGDGYVDSGFMSANYYVPCVEAWYPEAIGVDRFKHVLKIDWQLREVDDLTNGT